MMFFSPHALAGLATLLSLAHAIPITTSASHKRAVGATIRRTYSSTTCLGVTALSNGAILTTGVCTPGTGFYNQWDISPGDNQVVRLSGLPAGSGDWCLDAGLDFTSGSIIPVKIWQCYPGVPQQRHVDHIAIYGGNACVSSGRYGFIFTQGCFDSAATGGNPSSQTWKIVESSTPPPPPPPTGEGRTIRPTFNSNTCLGVTELANGAYLSSGSCTPTTGFYSRWDIVPGDNQVVRLSGLNWCLDSGLDYNSGSIIALKIWQCYPGVPQQRWYYTDDSRNGIFTQGCFDSAATGGNPSSQTWDLVAPAI
ncbi:hypothetical protein QFC21_006092 [Naganishia friedmannii]|uniref:Uncharacterized protein n=1 Tax=Naganishia friedmannii TaxID=89922 RepID=A0ACC2V5F0_9TREE|nr:hypothetical protein QFC21_006092 [Naganishia friedmannii]